MAEANRRRRDLRQLNASHDTRREDFCWPSRGRCDPSYRKCQRHARAKPNRSHDHVQPELRKCSSNVSEQLCPAPRPPRQAFQSATLIKKPPIASLPTSSGQRIELTSNRRVPQQRQRPATETRHPKQETTQVVWFSDMLASSDQAHSRHDRARKHLSQPGLVGSARKTPRGARQVQGTSGIGSVKAIMAGERNGGNRQGKRDSVFGSRCVVEGNGPVWCSQQSRTAQVLSLTLFQRGGFVIIRDRWMRISRITSHGSALDSGDGKRNGPHMGGPLPWG